MIEQALSEIKTREDEAKEAVKAAQDQAAASRGEADLALAEQVRQAKEQGKAYLADVMQEATLKADNQYRELVAKAEAEAKALQARLEPTLDGLATELLGEIVNGNC
ncbi:MAG: hypothetical protein J5755_02095 [Clostridia bacterium]|nr:hypothetical protein [Clostridia bacterium]